MTIAQLDRIPAPRRNELFHDIARLLSEAGAIDRALEHTGEGWCIDDTLEQIIERIGEEMRFVGKRRRLAKILKMGDIGNAA
jgi:hypothetical protein